MSMDRELVEKARQGVDLLSEFLEVASAQPDAFTKYFNMSVEVNKVDAMVCAEEDLLEHPDETNALAAAARVKAGKGSWADRNKKTVENFEKSYLEMRTNALAEGMGMNN